MLCWIEVHGGDNSGFDCKDILKHYLLLVLTVILIKLSTIVQWVIFCIANFTHLPYLHHQHTHTHTLSGESGEFGIHTPSGTESVTPCVGSGFLLYHWANWKQKLISVDQLWMRNKWIGQLKEYIYRERAVILHDWPVCPLTKKELKNNSSR